MGFWDAAASARPCANNLHLAPDTNTTSLDFYRPATLPDAQPNVKALKALKSSEPLRQ